MEAALTVTVTVNVIEVEAVKQAMTETIAKKTRMAKGNVRSIVTQAFGEAVGQPDGDDDAHYLILKMDGNAPELEAAYRTMAALMPKLMKVRQRRLEEQDIEALLNVLMPAPPADDRRKSLAFDNAAARALFLDQVPCLTSKEVALLAGHRSKNTSMTGSRWKQAGKLFSLTRLSEEIYPSFQFRDGQPHPTVARVLAALPQRKRPWQIAFWFTSSNGWLDGDTPADRLDDADAVIEAARHEAEDIVG
jgi:hypothetical protein